jgi:hypothetical protein
MNGAMSGAFGVWCNVEKGKRTPTPDTWSGMRVNSITLNFGIKLITMSLVASAVACSEQIFLQHIMTA